MVDVIDKTMSLLEQTYNALENAQEEDTTIGREGASFRDLIRDMESALRLAQVTLHGTRTIAQAQEARTEQVRLQEELAATKSAFSQWYARRVRQCTRLQAAYHNYGVMCEKASQTLSKLRTAQREAQDRQQPMYIRAEALEVVESTTRELVRLIGIEETTALIDDTQQRPSWQR